MDPLSTPMDDYYEDSHSSKTAATPSSASGEDNVDVSPPSPLWLELRVSPSLSLQESLRWKNRKDAILKEYTTSQHIKAPRHTVFCCFAKPPVSVAFCSLRPGAAAV